MKKNVSLHVNPVNTVKKYLGG